MPRPLAVLLLACAPLAAAPALAAPPETLEALGEALFFDTNLSANRTQSCATCHDPAYAFTDPRETEAGRAVSLGDDGASLGDRNAPTAMYAGFSPAFEQLDTAAWRGGQFHDGRAADLAAQAGGPPLNPLEMGMPDEAAVVARLAEDPDYIASFAVLFGPGTLEDPAKGYAAMTEALAAFEATPQFAPFDSKYDRWLRGEVEFTREEELGRTLFFSQQFTNCAMCHQLSPNPMDPAETFANYEFHNIGVPVNPVARGLNGVTAPDLGLGSHQPAPEAAGRFKVPTLRNVAVTGPYMHNGVFADLRTVILFYNSYNSRDPARLINPETGETFAPPEVDGTLSLFELETGPALDDRRIDALVAFLETLTDSRYEPLLAD